MNMAQKEYVQGGDVQYMSAFMRRMEDMAFATSRFPNGRGAWLEFCDHSREFKYMHGGDARWASLSCGMDLRVHVAHWMEENGSAAAPYYHAIGKGLVVAAANAIASKLALPVAYGGGTVAPSGAWFGNEARTNELAKGFLQGCKDVGVAHTGQLPSVGCRSSDGAPFFGGSITGIVWPSTRHFMQESLMRDPEPRILGIPSSGIDGCGVPFLLQKGLEISDRFLTHVPEGKTFGEEILAPARPFVTFVEKLIPEQIELHGIFPAGDGGVASLLNFESQPFTYVIENWVYKLPPIFNFLQDDLQIPVGELLMNVNWGIGCYILAPKESVETIIALGRKLKFPVFELGKVCVGERKIIFEPEDNLVIRPAE